MSYKTLSAYRIILCGFPTTTAFSGTSLVITLPAPTIALSPILKAPKTNALVAIKTLFPIVGISSFFSFWLPPSPIVTPCDTVTFSPIDFARIIVPKLWYTINPFPIWFVNISILLFSLKKL